MAALPLDSMNPTGPVARPDAVILIVEDNPSFRKLLQTLLENDGFRVLTVEDPLEVLQMAKTRQPDLILMDVALGNASGITLCRKLKAQPETGFLPVVLLSGAMTDEEFQLQGFEEGADDYVLKPISNELLLAKIRAALRRRASDKNAYGTLQSEGLALDTKARKALVNGRHVPLTRKEFDLLAALLKRKGQVVYTAQLHQTVWDYGASTPVDSHTVKVHVSSLRGKLGPDIGRQIVSVPGLGYRFENGQSPTEARGIPNESSHS
jgi:DNA-binding response OmpR family regulator